MGCVSSGGELTDLHSAARVDDCAEIIVRYTIRVRGRG